MIDHLTTFAGDCPVTFLVGLALVLYAATSPFRYAYRAYSRHCRTKNIAAHGWPTSPVDADGDVIYPKAEAEQ